MASFSPEKSRMAVGGRAGFKRKEVGNYGKDFPDYNTGKKLSFVLYKTPNEIRSFFFELSDIGSWEELEVKLCESSGI